MKKKFKFLALLIMISMVIGILSGCGSTSNSGGGGGGVGGTSSTSGSGGGSSELVTLTVYSQTANFSGEMQGWFAKILRDKFNAKINLISDTEGVYEARMESGNLGDIIVWGADGREYMQAVEAGFLLNWEEDNLVQDFGPYIWENMQLALEKNKTVSAQKDDEGNLTGPADIIYGFGHNVARSADGIQNFLYTWDCRWDLYAELGYPRINDLDDLIDVFEQMKEICPTDDRGNPTYAASLWPDWDGNYVMYVKAMATAYFGYDEFGFGHYNPTNGEFYPALEEGSPYLEMLKFFNKLYQRGLLDPDSMTQDYNKMIEKVQNGGVFWSIFNYAGSQAYNNEKHFAENKIMRPIVPEEATPIAYGLNPLGGNRIWSIGSRSQYPEIAMEIIDWLCTPEGRLTMEYGPKGLCWDYDENNKGFLTDFGKLCIEDRTTMVPEEWGGATFNDGSMQINNTTWDLSDINPETGEMYDRHYWASTQLPEGECEMDMDWRQFTGAVMVDEYLSGRPYRVAVASSFSEAARDNVLESSWQQVATAIKDGSWRAIYAESDADFERAVGEMRGRVMSYNYAACIDWSYKEAAIRNSLEEPLRQ